MALRCRGCRLQSTWRAIQLHRNCIWPHRRLLRFLEPLFGLAEMLSMCVAYYLFDDVLPRNKRYSIVHTSNLLPSPCSNSIIFWHLFFIYLTQCTTILATTKGRREQQGAQTLDQYFLIDDSAQGMKNQDIETGDPRSKYAVMMCSTQTWNLCKKMARSMKTGPPKTIPRRRLDARTTISVHHFGSLERIAAAIENSLWKIPGALQ